MRSPLVGAGIVVALVGGSGCGIDGLAFRIDERVEVLAPEDRAEVRPPFVIEWTVEDFDVTGPTPEASPDAGYFAVLVDRPPPPPGRTIAWLFRGDETCAATAGCPDDAYLAARDVYVTAGTSVTVERLPEDGSSAGGDVHEATVVLLDGTGRRIGESAFPVEFRVEDNP